MSSSQSFYKEEEESELIIDLFVVILHQLNSLWIPVSWINDEALAGVDNQDNDEDHDEDRYGEDDGVEGKVPVVIEIITITFQAANTINIS